MGHGQEGQGRRGTSVGLSGCPQGVDRLLVTAAAVSSRPEANAILRPIGGQAGGVLGLDSRLPTGVNPRPAIVAMLPTTVLGSPVRTSQSLMVRFERRFFLVSFRLSPLLRNEVSYFAAGVAIVGVGPATPIGRTQSNPVSIHLYYLNIKNIDYYLSQA